MYCFGPCPHPFDTTHPEQINWRMPGKVLVPCTFTGSLGEHDDSELYCRQSAEARAVKYNQKVTRRLISGLFLLSDYKQ